MAIPRLAKELEAKSLGIINSRLKDEYTAHYFYQSAANWCEDANYKKATAFFKQEAESELEHAQRLQAYITSWNCIPTLPTVKPAIQFSDLVDVVNKAYVLEYDLLQKYNSDSTTLLSVDMTTYDIFTEFRKAQYQSVAEYSDLLNALQLIDISNKFELLYFEQTYF